MSIKTVISFGGSRPGIAREVWSCFPGFDIARRDLESQAAKGLTLSSTAFLRIKTDFASKSIG